jgi:hypothetical protein
MRIMGSHVDDSFENVFRKMLFKTALRLGQVHREVVHLA